MDIKELHWSEQLAERVMNERKEPYVISGGMTTSGPLHFGTLCEFLFPYSIKRAIERKGKNCDFYFVADILDAFDSIPSAMEKYKDALELHLGKPLCNVPDPIGKSKSFGDHYLDEAREVVKKFGIECNIVRVNEYYSQGKFDKYASLFLKNDSQAKEIIEQTSGKTEKKDWSPIMPICKQCGKIATTHLLSHDGENYEYVCDRDVKYTKGCGYVGKEKIADHNYKIVWRLHWPCWMDIFESSAEGAGVDHHTRGGSWDSCTAVFKEMFKKEPPIGYKYGFILFQGKKYSKSKGTGMGVSEIIKLTPPEIVKYLLLKPDLQENIDINPTPENLLRAFDDFQETVKLTAKNSEELIRSDKKRISALKLSADKINWKCQFLDVVLYYQIYSDWERVGETLDDLSGVYYLKQYAEEWLVREFLPDEYNFKYKPQNPSENVRRLLNDLDENMDALGIHNAVFEFAKKNNIEPKQMFKEVYMALIGKERGPRVGKLMFAIGVSKLKQDLVV